MLIWKIVIKGGFEVYIEDISSGYIANQYNLQFTYIVSDQLETFDEFTLFYLVKSK